jgi:hypothetical protein
VQGKSSVQHPGRRATVTAALPGCPDVGAAAGSALLTTTCALTMQYRYDAGKLAGCLQLENGRVLHAWHLTGPPVRQCTVIPGCVPCCTLV